MSMNFKIKEQNSIDYEEAKKAYTSGIKGNKFRKMFNLGSTAYNNILKEFRAEGIPVKNSKPPKVKREPKHYQRNLSKGISYWTVTKMINGKLHYFGHYKTKAAAQQRVQELKANNWEGLLD